MWEKMQLQKNNAAKTAKVKMQLQDLFFIPCHPTPPPREVGRCVGVRWRAGVDVGDLRTGPVAAGVRVYSSVSHL